MEGSRRTIKDLFFIIIVFLWLVTNAITICISDEAFMIGNIIWMLVFNIIVLFKINNVKFNSWLNKEL